MANNKIVLKNIPWRPIRTAEGRKNTTSASATQIAKPMNIRLAPFSFLASSRLSIAFAMMTSTGASAFGGSISRERIPLQ